MQEKRLELTSFELKWIAIITMIIDHVGFKFFPQYPVLRHIGRISFPIFCFLLVEGFMHTSNKKKYAGRLFLFALISEVPFDLCFFGAAFNLNGQNVMFTLLIGFGMMFLMERYGEVWMRCAAAAGAMALAWFLKTDYNYFGILLILVFYVFYHDKKQKCGFNVIVNIMRSTSQMFGALSSVPIWFYNGKKGRSMKYFFYVFYPLHILIIYGIFQIYESLYI